MKKRYEKICSLFLFILLAGLFLSATSAAPGEKENRIPLPDLVITEIWKEGVKICYEVQNIGDATAANGHITGLLVNDSFVVGHIVDQDIPAGQSAQGCFDYDWFCIGESEKIKAWANHPSGEFSLLESDDTNNTREEIWKCSAPAPEITKQPSVSEITHDSAIISWDTNENSDSFVQFGTTPDPYDFYVFIPDMSSTHSVGLEGLHPATLYHYMVKSTDVFGESVESEDLVFETAPAPLPDLVINDIWNEGEIICYQLMNIGETPAPPGYHIALIIDEELKTSHPIEFELQPGERWNGCFEFAWSCSGQTDFIGVVADFVDGVNPNVEEQNEDNNARTENWKCDTTPPHITEGPIVSDITQNSAVISWITDKPADSLALYDTRTRIAEMEQFDESFLENHEVMIGSLDPSTTYHFFVCSADESGNSVTSGDRVFRTLPAPDGEAPEVQLDDPGLCMGTIKIAADANDNNGVKMVQFFMNDSLVFMDYSPPFTYILDTTKYENGWHNLGARAFDLVGNSKDSNLKMNVKNLKDSSYPKVVITQPAENDTLSGKVYITAILSDDTGIKSAYFYVDSMIIRDKREYSYPYCVYEPIYFEWDTLSATTGNHRIGIEAFDADNKSTLAVLDIKVDNTPPPQPKLIVEKHEVTRSANQFTVSITIKNVGDATATSIEIGDQLDGFQPIAKNTTGANYTVQCFAGGSALCIIKPTAGLAKNQTASFSFNAVPILGHPNLYQPKVGDYMRLLWRSATDTPFYSYPKSPVLKTKGGETMDQAHKNATKASDYLIATDKGKLFKLFTPGYSGAPSTKRDEVNTLISTMAQLAWHKQGVLGFVNYTSVLGLQNLLKVGGKWSNLLCSGWTSDGYLLIVGEAVIIPAGQSTHSATGFETRPVPTVDLFYSNTTGDILYPELNMGRIIGNTPKELVIPLETTIGVHEKKANHNFDKTHALAVSGAGEGADKFEASVDSVAILMKKNFINVKKLKQRDVVAVGDIMLDEFKSAVNSRDTIFFRDHGLENTWSYVINRDEVKNLDFVDTKPFAFACCCWAGLYYKSVNLSPAEYPFKGIAEHFLEKGVGIYIGACQTSPRCTNNLCADNIYRNWLSKYNTIGKTFKQLKRSIAPAGTFWSAYRRHLWISEYHLFGDPKYGVAKTKSFMKEEPARADLTPPPPEIEILVPDYETIRIGENDHVSIPGGSLVIEHGKPIVPFYKRLIDCPSGCRVQDVFLIHRSDPFTSSGLCLPIGDETFDGDDLKISVEQGEEWWPPQDYGWNVIENPDGSSTIAIIVYPFIYNDLTLDFRFHEYYHFELAYTTSTVAITELSLEKEAFAQGEIVKADMGLLNTGDPEDVVFSAVVKRAATDDVVDGLLLKTLERLEGEASFSPAWESAGNEPGFYIIEATLQDMESNILERKTELFRLGISTAEVTQLFAAPRNFTIGNNIDISMVFTNTGSVPTSATLFINVWNEAGEIQVKFEKEVIELDPGLFHEFNEIWNTTGAPEGTYTILGYAAYENKTTEPKSDYVTTRPFKGWSFY